MDGYKGRLCWRRDIPLDDFFSFSSRSLRKQFAQAIGQGPGLAVPNRAAVDFGDGGELAHGAGAEHFVSTIDFSERKVALGVRDVVRAADFQDDGAGDAFGAGDSVRREDVAAVDDEDMRGIGFRDEAASVEHEGVVGVRDIRLDFGEDRLNQIVVVNFGIEAVRWKTANATGD